MTFEYERWRFRRWDTPLSSRSCVVDEAILSEGKLHIIAGDLPVESGPRVLFYFPRTLAVLVRNETFLGDLVMHWQKDWPNLSFWKVVGNTWTVEGSEWLSHFGSRRDDISREYGPILHYGINTDDAYEILASVDVVIKENRDIEQLRAEAAQLRRS